MFVSSRKIQEQYSMPFIMHKFSSILHWEIIMETYCMRNRKLERLPSGSVKSIQLLMGNNQSPVSATSYLKHQSLNCVEQQPILTV